MRSHHAFLHCNARAIHLVGSCKLHGVPRRVGRRRWRAPPDHGNRARHRSNNTLETTGRTSDAPAWPLDIHKHTWSRNVCIHMKLPPHPWSRLGAGCGDVVPHKRPETRSSVSSLYRRYRPGISATNNGPPTKCTSGAATNEHGYFVHTSARLSLSLSLICSPSSLLDPRTTGPKPHMRCLHRQPMSAHIDKCKGEPVATRAYGLGCSALRACVDGDTSRKDG